MKLAAEVLEKQITKIDGVSNIQVAGVRDREIWVEVDPDRLKSYNLVAEQVSSALSQRNLNLPAGVLEVGQSEFLVRTMGEFRSVAEIAETIIKVTAYGTPVRVKDVARVRDTYQDARTLSRINGQSSISLTIQKKNEIHNEKKPPTTYQEESNISLKTNLENKKQTVSNNNGLTLNHIKKTWGEFLIKLEEKNSKLSHFLEDSKLISFNDKKIVIELLNGNQFQQSSLEKDINQIEDIFNEKYNEKVEFKIILNDSIKSEATIKKNKATEHPLFNEIMEKFDGEIIR